MLILFLFPPQLHSKSLFAKQDEPQKSVWSGWLACINGKPDYLHSLSKDFVSLPLFGSSGPEVLTSLVKSWFQQMFDCCFGPLEINQTSLQWLLALWTNCHTESNIKQLKMIWNIQAVPPLHVTYTVNDDDAWELWSSTRKAAEEKNEGGEESEEESCIDMEEVTRFMQGLKSHFYRHFRLDLSAGSLSEVSTALGSAKFSGRIKVRSHRNGSLSFTQHVFHCIHTRTNGCCTNNFSFLSDLQQQIHDRHPGTTDRVCPSQNAHLKSSDF